MATDSEYITWIAHVPDRNGMQRWEVGLRCGDSRAISAPLAARPPRLRDHLGCLLGTDCQARKPIPCISKDGG